MIRDEDLVYCCDVFVIFARLELVVVSPCYFLFCRLGLLLALGLQGHLGVLSAPDISNYLTQVIENHASIIIIIITYLYT